MLKKLSIVCITILLLSVSLYKIKAPEKENKLVIRVSFINMWPGFTIDELPMIKEIIEENGRTIVIDHNNYDLIIDSVFGQRNISNKDSIKIV